MGGKKDPAHPEIVKVKDTVATTDVEVYVCVCVCVFRAMVAQGNCVSHEVIEREREKERDRERGRQRERVESPLPHR